MADFIKFPSIEQFRNICKQVSMYCDYHGKDKPQIKFAGTVKIHGTNAGVGYDYDSKKLWVQSRNRVIAVGDDNAGFAAFVDENKESFIGFFENQIKGGTGKAIIFGEWYGPSVQKGVGVSSLPDKRFTIFDFGDVHEGEFASTQMFMRPDDFPNNDRVDLIYNYPTFSVDVDFSDPEASIPKLKELTDAVEATCPVAFKHGVTGVGEGIVWIGYLNSTQLRFKVKGEKHSVTKTKQTVAVDTEKMKSVTAFIDYAVTTNRLEQGIDEVFTQNNIEPDVKGLGGFLKWVSNDVEKEESDVAADSGLERKDYAKAMTEKARRWFFGKYC